MCHKRESIQVLYCYLIHNMNYGFLKCVWLVWLNVRIRPVFADSVTLLHIHTGLLLAVYYHARQKHLGCKKVRGQSEATMVI